MAARRESVPREVWHHLANERGAAGGAICAATPQELGPGLPFASRSLLAREPEVVERQRGFGGARHTGSEHHLRWLMRPRLPTPLAPRRARRRARGLMARAYPAAASRFRATRGARHPWCATGARVGRVCQCGHRSRLSEDVHHCESGPLAAADAPSAPLHPVGCQCLPPGRRWRCRSRTGSGTATGSVAISARRRTRNATVLARHRES